MRWALDYMAEENNAGTVFNFTLIRKYAII